MAVPILIWRMVIVITALATTYMMMLSNMGERAIQERRGGEALESMSGSGRAMALVAEERLVEGDAPGALVEAVDALKVDPMAARAVRVAGLAAEMAGKLDMADGMLLHSSDFGWRDAATQLWLVREGIMRQDYDIAAQRGDAYLRIGGDTAIMFPVFRAMLDDPQARNAVMVRIADKPNWAEQFNREIEKGARKAPPRPRPPRKRG